MSFWALCVWLAAKTGLPAVSECLPLAVVSPLPLERPHPRWGEELPRPVPIAPESLRALGDGFVSLLWVNAGSYLRADGFVFRVGPVTEPHLFFSCLGNENI